MRLLIIFITISLCTILSGRTQGYLYPDYGTPRLAVDFRISDYYFPSDFLYRTWKFRPRLSGTAIGLQYGFRNPKHSIGLNIHYYERWYGHHGEGLTPSGFVMFRNMYVLNVCWERELFRNVSGRWNLGSFLGLTERIGGETFVVYDTGHEIVGNSLLLFDTGILVGLKGTFHASERLFISIRATHTEMIFRMDQGKFIPHDHALVRASRRMWGIGVGMGFVIVKSKTPKSEFGK